MRCGCMINECQQNLKNIMQVRNILQSKKKQSEKQRKANKTWRKSKQNKRVKTVALQQSGSKSKSRSNGSKENKNKKYHSKSKQKVSPIKIKNVKGCNTSPIIFSERTPVLKVSPIRPQQQNYRPLNSHRQNQKAFHTVSTKINTERTPIKRIVEVDNKKQTGSKVKKSGKNKSNKGNKTERVTTAQNQKKTKQNKMQKDIASINQNGCFKKVKKSITPINTNGPQRKQSYFDQQTIERFNLDNGQYFRRKRPAINVQQEREQKKNNYSTQTQNLCSLSFRQYGTQTDENMAQPAPYLDLEGLRRQQQMKWRIIYLELSHMKLSRTPQKIDDIIEESHRNISEFQTKCKQIEVHKNNNHYVIESPTKVRQALRRRRKSSEENKSLIKTLSDQRLLRQLENLDHFQDTRGFNNQQQGHVSGNNFCEEFEKQLENYQQEHQNQAPSFLNFQLSHIPELEYNRAIQVNNLVYDQILTQLCQQLVLSESLLHNYLKCQQPLQPPQLPVAPALPTYQEYKIECNYTYSTNLLYKLFDYLRIKGYQPTLLQRINKTLGNRPESSLKLLRNYFIENQEDFYQDTDSIDIVVDSDVLAEFQAQNMVYAVEGQYYYNHCVYSCFNQILDTLRPFGLHGPPPLLQNIRPIHKNTTKIYNSAYKKLTQILRVQMDRSDFGEQQIDPLKAAQRSYALMDKYIIQQQQEKWKKMQENIFEQKYFLAESIISQILNDQIMMIYNEFL